MDNLALDDIVLFAAVAEAGSFVAAARRLRQPKSTVSRRLQVLEQQLGLRLIERSTRRMQLTEPGQVFLERVRPALQTLREAAGEARGRQREPSGTLRLSVGLGLVTSAFSRLLADYMGRYPRVTLVLDVSDDRLDIGAGGFDLAIRAGALEDSALVQRKLGEARTVLVAAPSCLAGQLPIQAPDDLLRLRPLLQPRESVWTLSASGLRQELALNGPLLVGNLLMLAQAARDGLGVARLPRLLCQADLDAGRLVALLPSWEPDGHAIHALLPGRTPSSAVRALLTLLEEHAPHLFPA